MPKEKKSKEMPTSMFAIRDGSCYTASDNLDEIAQIGKTINVGIYKLDTVRQLSTATVFVGGIEQKKPRGRPKSLI